VVEGGGDHEITWAVMRVFNAARDFGADHPMVEALLDCWNDVELERDNAVRIAFMRKFGDDHSPKDEFDFASHFSRSCSTLANIVLSRLSRSSWYSHDDFPTPQVFNGD
jgi:hypothetical protein